MLFRFFLRIDCRDIEASCEKRIGVLGSQGRRRNNRSSLLGCLAGKSPTFFCSNVCAAWRRDTYLKLGGFEKKTVFNEDMIFAGRLIQAGGKIAYCADARVIHSHNYHAVQQFHRYFDLAVSQTMHPEVFGGVRSESEGMRLVVKSIQHCIRIGRPWLIFTVVAQNAGKFLGYRLGRRFQKLPRRLVLACTMNRSFWLEESE